MSTIAVLSMLQTFSVLSYNFREDSKQSSLETTALEESQQDVPPEESVYSNIDDEQRYAFEMSSIPETAKFSEYINNPKCSTTKSFPQQTPQISGNPAHHTAHIGAMQNKPATKSSKSSPFTATGSVLP